MADNNGWCTIESDPAVFTELMESMGVKGAVCEELISLDESMLQAFGQTYGLVLLFKWKPQSVTKNVKMDAKNIYFAQQVIGNACATQAIVNILCNKEDKVEVGEELKNLMEFTKEFDPRTRGEMIGQSDKLRAVHNQFSRTTVFSFEEQNAKEDDDVYHFVGFLYKDGAVWELDGLQPGPIHVADATEANWQAAAITGIQQRISEISALDKTGTGQGISFSLLAIVEDRMAVLGKQLEEAKAKGQGTTMLEAELLQLKEKREAGKLENVRRRHNYIPALVGLFRALAEKNKLKGIMDKAKDRAKEKSANKKDSKK